MDETYCTPKEERPTASIQDCIRYPGVRNSGKHLDGENSRRIKVDLRHGVLRVHMVLEVLRENRSAARSADEATEGSGPTVRRRKGRGTHT